MSLSLEITVVLFLVSLAVGFIIGRWRRKAAENTGEARVRRLLTDYCKDKYAHLLNNITVDLGQGKTTQIDHILITSAGVFVIETKDYKGWIFANPKAKTWTQVIYRSTFKFQNPLLQNYKHLKAVESLLDFQERGSIHGLVVFTGDAMFKTPQPQGVYYFRDLIAAIERFTQETMSLNRLQFCIGRIEYYRCALTHQTDIQHQAYLIQKLGES